MMAGICEGIDRAILEDKNGKRFEMPNIYESLDDIQSFMADRIESALNDLMKSVNSYNQFYYGIRVITDQQRIAQKLNLFKKLKFKPKYN